MAKVLTKPQRLKLMMQIAEFFATDPYVEIDTALETFSLPTFDQADGQKGYVLRSLRLSTDDQLLGLAHYVHLSAPFGIDLPIDLSAPASDGKPQAASNDNMLLKRFSVFVSHLAKEREVAGKLKVEFDQLGLDAFVAHDDIKPTAEWQAEIEQALSNCDALVALLHADFHESKWTDQEIGWALGRGIPVYAVKLGTDPYGFFGKVQAFNGAKKKPDRIADEIFSALVQDSRTALQVSASLVKLLEEASSYAQARTRVAVLERAVAWNPTLTEAVEKAVASNSQISGAWNVPGRVSALIAKLA